MFWGRPVRRIIGQDEDRAVTAGQENSVLLDPVDVMNHVVRPDVLRTVILQFEPLAHRMPGPRASEVLELQRGSRPVILAHEQV